MGVGEGSGRGRRDCLKQAQVFGVLCHHQRILTKAYTCNLKAVVGEEGRGSGWQ